MEKLAVGTFLGVVALVVLVASFLFGVAIWSLLFWVLFWILGVQGSVSIGGAAVSYHVLAGVVVALLRIVANAARPADVKAR